MDGVILSCFLIFIQEAHTVRYGTARDLQPYMWVTFFHMFSVLIIDSFFRGCFLNNFLELFLQPHVSFWSLNMSKLLIHLHMNKLVPKSQPEAENMLVCFHMFQGNQRAAGSQICSVNFNLLLCVNFPHVFYLCSCITSTGYTWLYIVDVHCIPNSVS